MWRLWKMKVAFVAAAIISSIYIAELLNHINVEYKLKRDFEAQSVGLKYKEGFELGTNLKNVMWFLQISDIHISIFYDHGRVQDLRDFCNLTVRSIKPSVVLASGDLADAKQYDTMGSIQFLQEWKYYSEVLNETKVLEETTWLDIRGNHDNFNVPGIHSDASYFHKYSVQGKTHNRSYIYTLEKDGNKYSFVGLDACLDPGPRRPFNFIGNVEPEEYAILQKYEKEASLSDEVIWFGHYPTSCILSPEPGIRHLMKNGSAYLCGHLHTLGGLVPNMYTMQKNGLLELELGDWKDNRLYRLAAFDNGLFSFVDVSHGKWPVILVTNPKDPMFNLVWKEPLTLIKKSTHVRLLIFSPSRIKSVKIKIDEGEWLDCFNSEGPLYTAPWNPQLYLMGPHDLEVWAENEEGQNTHIQQKFSLDGTHKEFKFLSRLALMSNAKSVFFGIFVFLVGICVLPLLMLRMVHSIVRKHAVHGAEVSYLKSFGIVRKLWILATVDRLTYLLVFYPLFITIGPWFIGEVIDDHIGVAFAWGTIVKGRLLPGAFSYFYGCVQLFCFHLPLIVALAYGVDARFSTLEENGLASDKSTKCTILSNHLPCAIIVFGQALYAYYFWLAYGTLALILGPLRTWSTVKGLYLWYAMARLEQCDFAEAKLIWSTNSLNTKDKDTSIQNGTQVQKQHSP